MRYLLTSFFAILNLSAFAQQLPNNGFNKVTLNEPEVTIKAELNPVVTTPRLKADRYYFWYTANTIQTTQGSYSGKLLNGTYIEYYLNKNLKEQGFFISGLKNGSWMSWNDKGILIASLNWKKGVKNGNYKFYNETGKLKEAGLYRKNLVSGAVYYYLGTDSVKTVYFKNGNIIQRKSFWQRLNIFSKTR